MDFLDPKKQKSYKIRLLIGYGLTAIALGLATTILVYLAKGYWLKNGQVVQNGLVFVSSAPNADMYVNGEKTGTTNARLTLEAGQYTLQLKRPGYADWQRSVTVQGGIVEHFDYPVLLPTQLTTSSVKQYSAAPGLMAQSLDRRWILVQDGNAAGSFDLFDTKSPLKVVASQFTLPDSSFTKGDGTQSWTLVAWAGDNRHVVLAHTFQKSGQQHREYVLVDRQDPAQSLNLATVLGANPPQLELLNGQYDHYYEFDPATGVLSQASLKQPQAQLYLDHVLAFRQYGDHMMLFVTDQSPAKDTVAVKLRDNDQTYTLRTLPAGAPQYLLDLGQYDGAWFMAAGASSENKIYVYKDPEATLQNATNVLVPIEILKLDAPNYLAFSPSNQYVMAESGDHFATYDTRNDKNYTYQIKTPLDAPQPHAAWIDGARVGLVSNGRTLVFDYDSANQRALSAATPGYLPFFDPQYEALYSLASPGAKIDAGTSAPAAVLTQPELTRTYLRTAADL